METNDAGRAVQSSNLLDCPECHEPIDAADWMQEALRSPINIVCDKCDCEFSISAVAENVRWTVTPANKGSSGDTSASGGASR